MPATVTPESIEFTSLGKNAQGYEEFREERTGIVFVKLPGGKFQMGSPASEAGRHDDEGPVHEVALSPFLIAKYELSQVGSNDSDGLEEWSIYLDLDLDTAVGGDGDFDWNDMTVVWHTMVTVITDDSDDTASDLIRRVHSIYDGDDPPQRSSSGTHRTTLTVQ